MRTPLLFVFGLFYFVLLYRGSAYAHNISADSECSFVESSPRYYSLEATVQVTGARSDILLSDALLRVLAADNSLADCQIELTEGTKCSVSLADMPCQDPFYLCGGKVAVSAAVYEAAISGVCRLNPALADSPICRSLAQYPSIAQLAAADKCEEVCVATPANTTSGTGSKGSASTAPAPAPSLADSCLAYMLTVRTATEEEANDLAEGLRTAESLTNLTAAAIGFAEPNGLATPDVYVANPVVTKVVGFGSFPPPPPPPPSPPPPLMPLKPRAPPSPPASQQLPLQHAANGTLVYESWSDCSAPCGEGVQVRSVSCVGAGGAVLPMEACPGAAAVNTSRPCKQSDCTSYWQYSAWGTCNATCGGGYAFRSAVCKATPGSKCGSQPYPTVTHCNTMPCQVYVWGVGAWGECSKPCGGGERTRTVQCLDSAGQSVNASLCSWATPADTAKCNLGACDFCAGNGCIGHGSCGDGKCSCTDGYSGEYCEVPPSCDSKVVDADLACCPTGLLNSTGSCCPKDSVLDHSGACCTNSKLDACGVCGGFGVAVDITGTCCSTVLDAQGLCCESGRLDECGVCDGLSNTCAITAQLSLVANPDLIFGDAVLETVFDDFFANLTNVLQLPASSLSVDSLQLGGSSKRRRALQGASSPAPAPSGPAELPAAITATITLLPNGTGTASDAPFTVAWMEAALAEAAQQPGGPVNSGPIALTSAPNMQRLGVCGNGICEVGESTFAGSLNGTCPEDCPIFTHSCSPGCVHGTCLAHSGECQCFTGYGGGDCSACAAGFLLAGDSCVVNVIEQGLVAASLLSPPPTPSPSPSPGPSPAPSPPPTDGAAGTDSTFESPAPSTSTNVQENSINEAQDSGKSSNLGSILGGVLGGLAAAAIGVALFIFIRRRRHQREFYGSGPMSSSSYPGQGDVESVYQTAEDELGLRQKYSRTNSLASGSVMSAGSHGVLKDGYSNLNRKVTSSQEFRKYMSGWAFQATDGAEAGGQGSQAHSGASSSSGPLGSAYTDSHLRSSLGLDPLRQSVGSLPQSARGAADSRALRQSLSASTTSLPPRPPRHPHSLRQSQSSLNGLSRLEEEGAEAPAWAGDELAGDVRCSLSSVPLASVPSRGVHAGYGAATDQRHPAAMSVDAGAPDSALNVGGSLDHFGQVIMRSYTISPLDPKAKLFYNPAYNTADMLISRSTETRPRSAYKPLSARELPTAGRQHAADLLPLTARVQSEGALPDMDASLDTSTRHERLERMRAAVHALEADKLPGRLSWSRPEPAQLESPEATRDTTALHSESAPSDASTGSAFESGMGEGAASPVTMGTLLNAPEQQGGRKFLQGRPAVPRLPLHKLTSPIDPRASVNGPCLEQPLALADGQQLEAQSVEPAATLQPAQPALPAKLLVPKLPLHKLQAAQQPYSQPGSSRSDLIKAHPGGDDDPIDSLDSVLGTARPTLSDQARPSIADSFKKMVTPLLSARRREVDWVSQLSARGIGTPREDCGMLRTRPEDCERLSPDRQEELAGQAQQQQQQQAAGVAGAQPQPPRRYLGDSTPRGQLLRLLAAEAAAAHKERSLRQSMGAPSAAGFDDVMAIVDGSLSSAGHSAAPSPSRIPKAAPAAQPAGRRARSPSRIPSPSKMPSAQKSSRFASRLSLRHSRPSADENGGGSGPPSPAKAGQYARGNPMRGSIENRMI